MKSWFLYNFASKNKWKRHLVYINQLFPNRSYLIYVIPLSNTSLLFQHESVYKYTYLQDLILLNSVLFINYQIPLQYISHTSYVHYRYLQIRTCSQSERRIMFVKIFLKKTSVYYLRESNIFLILSVFLDFIVSIIVFCVSFPIVLLSSSKKIGYPLSRR